MPRPSTPRPATPKRPPLAAAIVTRCINPACGSTRAELLSETTQDHAGLQIRRRRVRCLDCNQIRIDRTTTRKAAEAPEPLKERPTHA